jgi:hypothetical protein
MMATVTKSVPKDVISVIENLTSSGELDLEEVLATLSAGIVYAKAIAADQLSLRGKSFDLTSLLEARRLVNLGLAKSCELPNQEIVDEVHQRDPLWAHREFFRRLLRARRGDLPRIRVFTTNYDLVVEKTLDDAGVAYFDGFVGTVDRVFRPEVFEQDIYLPPRPTERALTRLSEVLYIYKLHGSINWRSVESAAGLGSDVVVQSGNAVQDAELAIIYPTPQKEADVLGYPYSELFRAFSNVVAAPETGLLVIGYGFSDEHINRFIFQALAASPTFQLFVTSPGAVKVATPTPSPQQPDAAESLNFAGTVAGRLARLEDARVSVLAGALGRFVDFATRALPDPDELADEESPLADLSEQLAKVLQGGADDAPTS